jgi:MtfA peptidase
MSDLKQLLSLARKFYRKYKSPRKIEIEQEFIMLEIFFENNIPFYKLLNKEDRENFIKLWASYNRWSEFRFDKSIIKEQHDDIRLLITSALAMLTFGMEEHKQISKFLKFSIKSNDFYSRLINQHVKGLTVGSGWIFLSWRDAWDGFRHPKDRINLVLHELAHALYIENFRNSRKRDWMRWKQLAKAEINRFKMEGNPVFFRNYAYTNIAEFFAVCVECFFEDPIEFRRMQPKIYEATCNILQLDLATFYHRKKA